MAKASVAAFADNDGIALLRAFEELTESPSAAAAWRRQKRLCRTVPCRHRRARGAPAGNAGRARAHFRPAGSAPADLPACRARRAQRRHLAAGDAQRSLAEPPDARRPRPRSARAPHRPCRARLRASARRRRSDSVARRQGRRLADGRLALRAAHRRARRRGALAAGAGARQRLSRLRPRARSSGGGEIRRAPGADAESRGAAAARCRSPPSRTGCAIPIRSTPNTYCA